MKSSLVLTLLSVLILLVVGLFIISTRQTTTAPTIDTPTNQPIKRADITPESSSVASGGAVMKK